MRRAIGWVIVCMLVGVAALGLVVWDTPAHADEPPRPTAVLPTPVPPPAPQARIPLAPEGPRDISFPIPRRGDQRLLVILVDFPDQRGQYTGQQWHTTFFGSGGFADYFQEVSYNQLRYTGDIVGITEGTAVTNSPAIAYVRLPNPITYYTDDSYGYYGAFPANHQGVVYHALEALAQAGFSFSPYANPVSQEVENVVVVFAGRDYVYTHDATHSLRATGYWLVSAPNGRYVAPGGQWVRSFTLCPEQTGYGLGEMALIGICVHEHGHGLGAPDLYDLGERSNGVGRFDVMSYGAYGATDGLRPFQAGAFTKEFLGWITPTVMAAGTSSVDLPPVETSGVVLKLYPGGDTSSREYFLLENRQPIGFDVDWSLARLCPGLVIWHVDGDVVRDYLYSNKVNTPGGNGPPHHGVTVVEADGDDGMQRNRYDFGECADTWAAGRQWDPFSWPNSRLWDYGDSQIGVRVLSQSHGTVKLSIRVAVDPVAPTYRLYFPLAEH